MSAYSSAVLADAPLIYFRPPRMGTAIVYSQGSQSAALTAGTATALAAYSGPVSDAASIVAATQYQSVFPGAVSKPYSLECWVWTSHDGSTAVVGDFLTANPDQSVSNLFGFSWGGVAAFHAIQPTSGSQIAGVRVPMSWQHLAVTVDGTTMTLYVDGSSAGTTADHTALNTFSTQIITNVTGFNTGVFVAEVAFYASLLSGSRVAAHHTAGAPASVPPQALNGLASCG
jgi:hypothetical protein